MNHRIESIPGVLPWRAGTRDDAEYRAPNFTGRPHRPRSMVSGLAPWGLVLIFLAGCDNASAPVKVAPVAGIVRYQGVPVRDAYVKFIQKGCPIIAGGFTDDTGRFELTSYESGDGAPVGENAVTITAVAQPAADTGTSQAAAEAIGDPVKRKVAMAESASQKKSARAEAGSAQTAQPRSRIPKKYASEETSNLSFTVEAGTQNECEFDLED